MLTAGLNALAMARLGITRWMHDSRDGFGLLLMGLTAIGVAIWAVVRSQRGEPAKN